MRRSTCLKALTCLLVVAIASLAIAEEKKAASKETAKEKTQATATSKVAEEAMDLTCAAQNVEKAAIVSIRRCNSSRAMKTSVVEEMAQTLKKAAKKKAAAREADRDCALRKWSALHSLTTKITPKKKDSVVA